MGFDIRAILARSLGGREDREPPLPVAEPDATTDEEMPSSPILAAESSAAEPETMDMAQGGATRSTMLIPEGVSAIPSAAVDRAASASDEAVDDLQAHLVAEVAIAATMVNGELDQDERDDLLESLQEVPGLDEYGDAEVRETMAALRERGGEEPSDFVSAMEDRLSEISDELTDPALRRAAYQLAVYFCAWDGELSDEETDLLEAIAEAFEIPDSEARTLREATVMEAGEEGLQPGAGI